MKVVTRGGWGDLKRLFMSLAFENKLSSKLDHICQIEADIYFYSINVNIFIYSTF